MGAGKPLARALKESGRQFRLITRSDFDGLVCAVLFEEMELIDDILFVHPRQMQYGEVDLTDNDISTNVPFDERVYLAFDHHLSEMERVGGKKDNHVIDPTAPSAARVVYNYFGGEEGFPYVSGELMDAVDQADSAQYEMEDVLNPQGWALLNFIMDPRTGLGRFRGFRIPNYELMMGLIEDCRNFTIEEILELPDVKERIDLYNEHRPKFEDQLRRCTTMHGKLAVIDMRKETDIYCGNRFLIYALFPECNISMHVVMGKQDRNTVFAVGKSIFDRSSPVNVGELMLRFGGGGHRAAGTCQADNPIAEETMAELIHRISTAT
ncbi:exopolyphosphatase [Alphaproteobacteria bacterium LMO-S08]|nr:exopolyphosphatase [Alphaproteobacteria bacterium LMO-S08]